MPNRMVYIVGEVNDVVLKAWDVVGVFTSEARAVEACTSEDHFVGPMRLNMIWPEPSVEWYGLWYPLREDMK